MESWVHEPGSTLNQSVEADTELIGLERVSKIIDDLRRWADPYVLASWVVSEVDAFGYGGIIDGTFDQMPESDPRALLSILTYSYAVGIYSSEDIVRNCRTNEAFDALSGGRFLFRHELKWFRCRHRPQLIESVSRVFIRAICEWYGLGRTDVAPYLERYLRRLAVERLDVARHLDTVDE